MNDLDLIRELAPDERLPGVTELASARGRLTAAIATEVSSGAAQRTAQQAQARPRHRAGALPPGHPARRPSGRGGQPGGSYSPVSPRRPSPRV